MKNMWVYILSEFASEGKQGFEVLCETAKVSVCMRLASEVYI